ncbi:hypothetical protein PMAYCL1PPCAC_15655, partial [Pristionchus mayeri]
VGSSMQLGFGIFVLLTCSILNCLISVLHSQGTTSFHHFRIVHEIMFVTSDLLSVGPALYTILLPGPIRSFLTRKIT